jgi:uncharacterized NAD(P)/FAD-binding protein YdhS
MSAFAREIWRTAANKEGMPNQFSENPENFVRWLQANEGSNKEPRVTKMQYGKRN